MLQAGYYSSPVTIFRVISSSSTRSVERIERDSFIVSVAIEEDSATNMSSRVEIRRANFVSRDGADADKKQRRQWGHPQPFDSALTRFAQGVFLSWIKKRRVAHAHPQN